MNNNSNSQQGNSNEKNQKGIENHKQASSHYEAASKSHLEAAKYCESGDSENEERCKSEAQNHSRLGNESQQSGMRQNR